MSMNDDDAKKLDEAAYKQTREIVGRARGLGIEHILMGWTTDGRVHHHIEKMSTKEAFSVVISLFCTLCEIEAGQGHVTEEYRSLLLGLERDFLALVKDLNKKVEALKIKKNNTKTA